MVGGAAAAALLFEFLMLAMWAFSFAMWAYHFYADTLYHDECRGRMVCDMHSYICAVLMRSPATTSPPGCCCGDSYMAIGKCASATGHGKGEGMSCHCRETATSAPRSRPRSRAAAA